MTDVTTVLLVLVFAASLWQPTIPRLYGALVTSVFTTWHYWGYFDMSGLAYYGSAALIDLAIVLALSGIDPVPRMVVRLQFLAILSVVLNLIGWIMWRAYAGPELYNFAYCLFYLAILVTLLRRGETDDVGGYRVSDWHSCFRFSINNRAFLGVRNSGKA